MPTIRHPDLNFRRDPNFFMDGPLVGYIVDDVILLQQF